MITNYLFEKFPIKTLILVAWQFRTLQDDTNIKINKARSAVEEANIQIQRGYAYG